MVITKEDSEVENNWLLRRYGRFILDIHIDLEEEEIVLGRGYNRGVKYTVGVSRRHALLKRTSNGQWKIKDLGSMNGLFINATKVSENCFQFLNEFDIIGLGVANAIHEEHFSFMLCRKPEVHLYDGQILRSPVSPILIDSMKRNRNAEEQNLNHEGGNRNIHIGHCNKEGAEDADIHILFKTTNYKWKQKDIIVLSDDTYSEEEVVRVPRKRRKLHKRKPIVISSDESDCTCDEMIVSNAFPCKTVKNYEDFLNSKTATPDNNVHRGNIKFKEKNYDPNKKKVNENQDLYSQCDQNSKQSSSIDTAPILKLAIVEQANTIKRESFSVVGSATIPKKSKCLNLTLDFDITDAIHEEEKFYSQANNVIILSDEEDFEEHKQIVTPIIKKECMDAYIKKEPTDIFALTSEKMEGVILKEEVDINDASFKEERCNDDDEEMPLCDTVDDDVFDYGENTDYNIDEEELLGRLVWASNSDDWNKEDVSDLQLAQITSNSDKIGITSNNEKAKEPTINEIKDNPLAQIKSVEIKSCNIPIKLIEAVPMHKTSDAQSNGPSVKNKMRDKRNFHVPHPSGGSAIRKCDIPYSSKQISSGNDIKHKIITLWSKVIKETTKKLSMEENNAHNSEEPKNPTSPLADVNDSSFKKEQCSEEEMPLCNTLDDVFDYGENMDYNIDEEELSSNLIQVSNPDDWNKENVSNPQLSQITSNSGKINIKLNNEKAKELIINEIKDTRPEQTKSVKIKSYNSCSKLIASDALSNGPSVKDKMTKKMNYHVPCPGGGSAVRKHGTPSSLKRSSSGNDIKHKTKTSWAKFIKETTMKLPMGDNNARNSEKPKKATSTQVVQRFASRSDLLLQSMLESDSAVRVNKRKMTK